MPIGYTGAMRTLSILALALSLMAGCGRGHGSGPGKDPPLTLVLKPWGPVGTQTFPGTEVALKVVALKSAGQAIEEEGHLIPAVGEAIAWSFVGTPPATATLSQAATATDGEGFAGINVFVGTQSTQSFQVRAAAAGTDPVTFSIQVGRDDRTLQLLVPSPLATVVNRSERLRARLTRLLPGGAIGPAIGGAELRVELLGGMRNGARLETSPGDVVTVTTDGAGMASVKFLTGSVPQDGYQIVFCPGVSCPGVAPVTVTVNVALRGSGGADCVYFTDCEDGYVCDLGVCKPAGNYCDENGDCPAGYVCSPSRECALIVPGGGVCQPCFDTPDCSNNEVCNDVGRCVPPGSCLNNNDCPATWTCDQCGACLPPASPENVLDVRGLWFTTYHFDISDTLPGFFQGMGPVVDFLNLAFHHQIDINIPIVGDILEAMLAALVDEYVPDWARTIVAVLADFIHLFENMEVEGEMQLVQPMLATNPPRLSTAVTGQEAWTSAQFFVASFCPGGPAQFQADPSCGAVDVILDSNIGVDYSNEDLIVDVNLSNFTGQVMVDTLRLYGRDVEIELAHLITVLLDVIVQVASGGQYSDFETFLVDVVPCYDFQLAVDDLFCDITGGDICHVPGIEQLCEAAALTAVTQLNDALGDVSIAILELGFDQRALIHDVPLGGAADILGDPTDPADNLESAIIGETEFGPFGGELDDSSWWFGVRDRD